MTRYHRIVWSEGLFLTPHHLQQADLFRDHQLTEWANLLRPYPWGVWSLDVDLEGLATGTFRLLSFRGVLPSGALICFPELEPTPASVDLREAFDIRADHLDIYLGLPLRRSGWPNCRLGAGSAEDRGEVRYSARPVIVEDDNTGRDERTIERAEMNLALLRETDGRDNHECLPIARVEKTAAGGFRLVDGWVPPLLAIEPSPWLRQLVRSLLERLVTKSTELSANFAGSGLDGRDVTPSNLRSFLYFHAVNGAIPLLAHARETGTTHPEELYRWLAGLAGQLATFAAARVHPRDVPAYRHDEPGPVFAGLERLVVELLDLKDSPGYHVLPLTKAGEGRFRARIDKENLLQPSAALYLTIASDDIGEREIGAQATRIILASPDRLERLISTKLPGLPLQPIALPPPAIPRRRNTWVYQLDTRGSSEGARREWDAIASGRSLEIDVPAELVAAQFELLGLEGGR